MRAIRIAVAVAVSFIAAEALAYALPAAPLAESSVPLTPEVQKMADSCEFVASQVIAGMRQNISEEIFVDVIYRFSVFRGPEIGEHEIRLALGAAAAAKASYQRVQTQGIVPVYELTQTAFDACFSSAS